jgi:H+-translocating NAD(P) transhydrogenase subunit alpha
MRIVVPKEVTPGERRVALAPETVGRLTKSGLQVGVEKDAGTAAFFPDAAYTAAGAIVTEDGAGLLAEADIIVKIQRPNADEARRIREGSLLVSLIPMPASHDVLPVLAERNVTALALERVPRITRAQTMDVLSSQATVAGYKAVLIGAAEHAKLLPMLTTAAGNIPPAKAFVIGAGVAGLQAIATARRLGAVVSAFDVRAAAKEQVLSLGATFVAAELASTAAETAGGYAKEQSQDEQQRTLDVIGKHIKDQDLVITTAQIPGKPAPRLITKAMVESMRPGSVIVDLAAEQGGNCEVTKAGEIVAHGGVSIVGITNLPGSTPYHASLMFSKNVHALLQHLIKDGALKLDLNDEIAGPMCVCAEGKVRV